MTRVTFISADGHSRTDVEAEAGACLLDVAQACGQPLEGTCEGQMACSTCHVIVDAGDFAKLPCASENEELRWWQFRSLRTRGDLQSTRRQYTGAGGASGRQ